MKTPMLESFRPTTLLKRDFNMCFPVNIAKFLRTATFENFCEQLLLDNKQNKYF